MQSPSQKQVKEAAALKLKKGRDGAGCILVEGRHPVEEALRAGLTLISLWIKAGSPHPAPNLPEAMCLAADETMLKRISTTDSAPPCLAVFKCPQPAVLPTHAQRVLLLDGIQDPGNAGTLIRSAVAFGADAVVLTSDSVEIFSPKVIRASAGLVFALPVLSRTPEQVRADFKDARWQRLVTRTGPGVSSYQNVDSRQPSVLVLGNEGHGITEGLFGDLPLTSITIPMQEGVESLNVAICGSILLAHAAQQSGSGGVS